MWGDRVSDPAGPRAREVPPVEDDDALVVEAIGAEGTSHDVVFARPLLGRSRWLAAGVVGLIGLVVASVALGGGGDNAVAPTTARSAAPVARATVAPAAATTEAASSTSSSVDETTPPEGPATTQPTSGRVGSGPLLGEPSGLVVYSVTVGRLVRLDLDSGVITETAFAMGSDQIWPTSVGAVAQSSDRNLVLVPPDGTPPRRLAGSGAWLLGEGPPGRLWYQEPSAGEAELGLFYRDGPDGEPVRVAVPAGRNGQLLPDGTGGVLVSAGGGVYRLVPRAPPRRLGSGYLVDARNGYSLEYTCDAVMVCGFVVRDVRTGVVRPAPGDAARVFGAGGGQLSPDGRWVLVRSGGSEGTPSSGITALGPDAATVDLGSAPDGGCVTANCPAAPSWSPDGRWVIGSREPGVLWAWRPGLDAPLTITIPRDIGNGSFTALSGAVAPVPAG